MGEIDKIQWNDGKGLQELSAFGPPQICTLAEIIIDESNAKGQSLAYLVHDIAVDMKQALERFANEIK